ncbi:hypothetical protein RRG08_060857 [Elysia crispata]|uniref:Uncharacterized protein n=1 Tax=Elysia crispata TaxID=231223 RepID=A0AAE1DG03_9GAST|nr:hypothetical protein RRG08_060857 [Elysia crispata]
MRFGSRIEYGMPWAIYNTTSEFISYLPRPSLGHNNHLRGHASTRSSGCDSSPSFTAHNTGSSRAIAHFFCVMLVSAFPYRSPSILDDAFFRSPSAAP